MDFEIKPLADLSTFLIDVLKSEFSLPGFQCEHAINNLNNFLSKFTHNLFVGIESQYTDKLYRDAYYHYYSSKLKDYKRDCIRLSFFDVEISLSDFQSLEGSRKLQEHYKGFLVLRPTPPNIIGRNILHPSIHQKPTTTYNICARIPSTIYGIKLTIEGFPHASQDSEFMVCAETTLWSVMEYFAHKYADYKPLLPKEIHGILAKTSIERQVPSGGLTSLQISFALKELGFGVKNYSTPSYSREALQEIIQIYIESGIPVITPITNDNVGHVLNIVGRTEFETKADFAFTPIDTLTGGNKIFNYYEQPAKYLTIDDNLKPYAPIPLNAPSCNYADPDWSGCEIEAAIVPLHHRVYMEADKAKEVAIEGLKQFDKIKKLPSLILRILLSSGRNFKNKIALNPDLSSISKAIILNIKMPKFVWIAEVATQESFIQGKATGMLLMDATEPQKPEILAYLLENEYIKPINGTFGSYSLALPPFSIFHNLKSI